MPVVDELKSINRLEEAGQPHEQAKAIVEVIEQRVQRGFERFAEVLDRKMEEMDHRLLEMEQRLRLEMQTLRAELLKDQRDQMLKFAALVTVIVGVIGAALKFF
jgi:hypothetical protein